MTDSMETGAGDDEQAGTDTPAAGPDPRLVSLEVFEQRIRAGATTDAAQSDSLRVLVDAAMRGDQRVIYNEDESRVRRMSEELGVSEDAIRRVLAGGETAI